jgi:hypothetical protein
MALSDYIETDAHCEWRCVVAGVTFGKKDGHRIRLGFTIGFDILDIGVSLWRSMGVFQIGLGPIHFEIEHHLPYHPATDTPCGVEPLTEEDRAEDALCGQYLADIDVALCDSDIPSGGLAYILAIVRKEAGDGAE